MNNSPIIKSIVENKIPCFFISPHLDDAVLSAGDLIAYLADKTSVHVVSIFTTASSRPYTFSAKAFLRQSGFTDALQLFEARKLEDNEVLKSLGVKGTHLNFVDAALRKRKNLNNIVSRIAKLIPEFGHTYPIHRIHIHSNKIKSEDSLLIEEISHALRKIVEGKKQFVVFCPLATNTHIDHVLTRKICEGIFEHPILWSDFPYNSTWEVCSPSNDMELFTMDFDRKKKLAAILGYKTQVKAMFPSGEVPLKPERFFVPQAIISKYSVL